MSNQRIFNEVLQNTISNTLLHHVLLVIDYYPIFISSISLPLKFAQYNKEDFASVSPSVLIAFPFRHIPNGFNNIISIVLFCLIVLFLFLYFLLFYIENQIENKQKETIYSLSSFSTAMLKIMINFYDLAFFRYGSAYIIFFFIDLMFNYAINREGEGGVVITMPHNLVITILIGVVFLFYLYWLMSHIKMFFACLHLKNNNLSLQVCVYPYDWILSRHYDLFLVITKVIVGIEYFLIERLNIINPLVVYTEILIIIMLILLVLTYLRRYIINEDSWYFIFNRSLNMTRIHILLTNVITLILFTLFIDNNSSVISLVLIVAIVYVLLIVVIVSRWQIRVRPLFYNGIITLPKLFYLVTSDPNDAFNSSCTIINLNQMIDAFVLQHSMACTNLNESSCLLCTKYLTSTPRHNITASVLELFRYLMKSKQLPMRNNQERAYSEIMTLFYFHYKKKIFKFYTYQKLLLNKYAGNDKMIHNLNYIANSCLSFYDKYDVSFFKICFVYCKMNRMIDETLMRLNAFVNLSSSFKYPEKFFKLAKELNELKEFVLKILKKIEMKEEMTSSNDHAVRSIKSVYQYNLKVNRFTVEKLINQSYLQLSAFNIETIDDYLESHYVNDKILVIVFDLQEAYEANSNNFNYFSFKTMKNGRELNLFKGAPLIDLFPKKFKNYGIKSIINILSQYKDYSTMSIHIESINANITKPIITTNGNANGTIKEVSAESQYVFEYLRNTANPGEVEYLKYPFRIGQTLDSGKLLIYGFYKMEFRKIIVFSENKKPDSELILFSFSNALLSSFIFNQEWIEILSNVNFTIPMTSLFKSYTKTSYREIECLFDMGHFFTKVSPMFNFLKEIYQKDKAKYDAVMRVRDAMKERLAFKIQMKLKWILDIPIKEKYSVYAVTFPNVKAKMVMMKDTPMASTNDYWEQEDNTDEDNNITDMARNPNMTVATGSNSSLMGNASLSSLHGSSLNGAKSRKHFELIQKNEQDKLLSTSKAFTLFSRIIVTMNTLLIILCAVFLIIEIDQTDYLDNVNDLYNQYKMIRINNAHLYLSIFANLCLAPPKGRNCIKVYEEYSQWLITKLKLNESYRADLYVYEELKHKVHNAYVFYYDFIESLYEFNHKELIDILTINVTYMTIYYDEDRSITQQYSIIPFEEGLKKFINSITLVIESDIPYYDIPLNIIKFNNGNIDYDELYDKELTAVQRELYQIIVNYILFSDAFNISEDIFTTILFGLKGTNQFILITFMIIIEGLNLILGALCLWMLHLVEKLFINFITQMIKLLDDSDYKEYFNNRITYLISLNKLYDNNPNYLIQSIKKDEIKTIKKFREKLKKINSGNSSSTDANTTTEDQALVPSLTSGLPFSKAIEQRGLSELLSKYYIKTNIIIGSYLIIAIGFDVFLVLIFKYVFIVLQYAVFNVKLINLMFNNIGLSQTMILLTMNQFELGEFFNIFPIDSDGYTNMLVRQAEDYLKEVTLIQNKTFRPIDSYFNYTCEGLFLALDDNEINNSDIGEKYLDFQAQLCSSFNMLRLPNFIHLYDLLNLKAQKYINLIDSFEYNDLYRIHKDYDKYEMYTISLILFKPFSRHLKTILFDAQMKDTLDYYIMMIWLFLCFNIIADVLMFVYIKIYVMSQVNSMYSNLQLLSDCFQNS